MNAADCHSGTRIFVNRVVVPQLNVVEDERNFADALLFNQSANLQEKGGIVVAAVKELVTSLRQFPRQALLEVLEDEFR